MHTPSPVRRLAIATALMFAAAGCGSSSHAVQRQIAPAPAFTAADLSTPSGTNWIAPGGDGYNQRYSALKQITAANVSGLKVAWKTHLDGSGAGAQFSAEGSPVVYDGKVFVGEPGAEYGCRCAESAYDAKTGKRLWGTYMIPAPGQPGSNTWPSDGSWKRLTCLSPTGSMC